MDALEISSISIALPILVAYNAMILYYTITSSSSNVSKIRLGLNIKNAKNWALKHEEQGDAKALTLAIQTMRYTLLIGTFVGGFAFKIAFENANAFHRTMQPKRKIAAMIMSSFLFLSFMCFSNVIRYASQLGWVLGTASYKKAKGDSTECCKDGREHDAVASSGVELVGNLMIYFR